MTSCLSKRTILIGSFFALWMIMASAHIFLLWSNRERNTPSPTPNYNKIQKQNPIHRFQQDSQGRRTNRDSIEDRDYDQNPGQQQQYLRQRQQQQQQEQQEQYQQRQQDQQRQQEQQQQWNQQDPEVVEGDPDQYDEELREFERQKELFEKEKALFEQKKKLFEDQQQLEAEKANIHLQPIQQNQEQPTSRKNKPFNDPAAAAKSDENLQRKWEKEALIEDLKTWPFTIFVSLGNYRDKECSATLRDMLEKAAFPERIFIGVAEQINQLNESCLFGHTPAILNRTRMARHPAKEALGCAHSRYLAASLYNNETYFLQIDSHTDFEPQWDVTLIEMYHNCPSYPYCVITHYPPDRATRATGSTDIPTMCETVFNTQGVISFRSHLIKRKGTRWVKNPFVGGGFVFGPGFQLIDVPYDDHLPHFVDGDEFLRSVRLWTSGYDLYAPTENVVWHHYYRHGSPKLWSDFPGQWNDQYAVGKVKYYCKQDPNPQAESYAKWIPLYDAEAPWFGLGNARTIEEYYEAAGIDMVNKKTSTAAKICGGL